MILETDLFTYAYVPNWYLQLDALAELALPEPWRFKDSLYIYKNTDTPILERYIQVIFRKMAIDYNNETTPCFGDKFFYVRNETSCFHTGLYNKRYKPIYGCFARNKKLDTTKEWCFKGFVDEINPLMRYIEPLPEKPQYRSENNGVTFKPDWPIRVNIDHILCDPENMKRFPESIINAKNLPLLLETAVELARRKAIIEPSIVVSQGFQNRMQFLLPLCLTNMETPDIALTLSIMDGYYLGNTCLTLEMSYLNARLIARPTAPWLMALVA